MPTNFPTITLSQIAFKYDAFLIDLWGVIHDGIHPYEGARETLIALKNAGKKVVFISNAPRRSERAAEALTRMGIETNLYDAVVTSGELVFSFIASGSHGFGKHYVIAGPERDAGLLDGLGYQRVENPSDADFVILTGYDHDDSPEDEKTEILRAARAKKLPVICANPDRVIVRHTGKRALCAGVIADHYLAMGGEILYFGKPYESVYEASLRKIGNLPFSRVAAIGDNLETDIQGANHFGIDSYLIAGGILSYMITEPFGSKRYDAELQKLCNEHGAKPSAISERFIW